MQEFNSLIQRIQKHKFCIRKGYLKGNARETGSCPQIQHSFYIFYVRRFHQREAVQKMLSHDILKLCDSRQVHDPVYLDELFIVKHKLLCLLFCKRNSHLAASLIQYLCVIFHLRFPF